MRDLGERLKSRKFLLSFSYLLFVVLTSLFEVEINSQVYWSGVVVVATFVGIEGLIDKEFLKERAKDEIDGFFTKD